MKAVPAPFRQRRPAVMATAGGAAGGQAEARAGVHLARETENPGPGASLTVRAIPPATPRR
jgi:hypothetical protein